jgi:hypothetical protein
MILYVLFFVLGRVMRLVWGMLWIGLAGAGLLWLWSHMQGESAALWIAKHLLDLLW